jgi:hypothetical protein
MLVQVQACNACGTAAVKGYLAATRGAAAGTTRVVPLPGGVARLPEIERATGVSFGG